MNNEGGCAAGVAGGALAGAINGSRLGPWGAAAGAAAGAALAYGSMSGPGGACGSSGGGGGGGRVICTHFYRKGMIDQETWRADLEFTAKRLPKQTVRGYQYWAIPYVLLMRRFPLAEKIMYPLAVWRAEELAHQMGKRELEMQNCQKNWGADLLCDWQICS